MHALLLKAIFAIGCTVAASSLLPGAEAAKKDRGKDDAGSDWMVRVEVPAGSILAQGDTEGCGPVSLLNLLRLGPADDRSAYEKLCGGKDPLRAISDRYCAADGARGRVRYSPQAGINDANLIELSRRVTRDFALRPFDSMFANRQRGEGNEAFVQRLHAQIMASLRRGVPVLTSVDSYAVRDGQWRKLTGHYVLITGVQALGTVNGTSFVMEYLDPVGATRAQAFVHASNRRPSRALAHFPDGDAWLAENPYLYVAAPSLDLKESKQEEGARHQYFLTLLLGRWSETR